MATHGAVSHLGGGDAEGGAPRGHTEPVPVHRINYLFVFYALIVLTVVTVVVAFKRFDHELTNIGIALLVASVKAMLVARYFMHLKFEGRLIKLALYIPLFLCVILVVALIPDIVRHRPVNDPAAPYNIPADGQNKTSPYATDA